jgi:CheY-like chemotaxis protein
VAIVVRWRRVFLDGRRSLSRILIVENDVHTRELARAFLTGAGHTVSFAGDGGAALLELVQSAPELVVTEIMLPKVDGLSLCERIKRDPETQHIKVLVVSMLAAAVRSREAGADGFLKKPLSERRLVDAVTSALDAQPCSA